MQSSDFEKYFNFFPNLKARLIGIFSIDTIPKKLKYRHFCIVNTDLSSNSGIHWFVLLQHEKKSIEVFDRSMLKICKNKKTT
jgi:hypothetical protein